MGPKLERSSIQKVFFGILIIGFRCCVAFSVLLVCCARRASFTCRASKLHQRFQIWILLNSERWHDFYFNLGPCLKALTHPAHAACILNRGRTAPSHTDVNPPLRLHTVHRCEFCVVFSTNGWQKQEKSKYSQAPSTAPRKPLKPEGVRSHRIEGGSEKAGSPLWCKVSLKHEPFACCPPHPAGRMCLVRWMGRQVCAAAGGAPFARTNWQVLGGKREGKACEWRRHWREFLSPQRDRCQHLDHRRERVPCVPQMGPLNMRGRRVQMADSETTEFTDKRPGPEIIRTNVSFLKRRDKCRGEYLKTHLHSSGWVSSLTNTNKNCSQHDDVLDTRPLPTFF